MPRKQRELTTRRMPSGAQQYVRPTETGSGDSAAARMRTINNVGRRSEDPGFQSALTYAIIDESRLARAADSNERQARDEDRANRRKEGGKMETKKMAKGGSTRASATATRPTPRPVMTERGSRHDEGMTREAMERGSSAPSRSPRPTPRRKDGGKVTKKAMGGKVTKKAMGGKVTKKAMGGKCRGMGAATRGGNYSRG